MKKSLIFLVVPCLLCSYAAVAADAKPASTDSVRAMMALTGAEQPGQELMTRILPALKRLAPGASDEFWLEVTTEIDVDQLEDMLVPVYQKYLTEEDIKAINAFYRTPVGQRLIDVQPKIMQESIAIGNEWGQAVAMKVLEKYQALQQTAPQNNSDASSEAEME